MLSLCAESFAVLSLETAPPLPHAVRESAVSTASTAAGICLYCGFIKKILLPVSKSVSAWAGTPLPQDAKTAS